MKEPTLYKIQLLQSTAYNVDGDILNVKYEDEQGNVYYYDCFHRWCYLEKSEENIIWRRI